MKFDGVRAWIRRHPVRLVVYLLLLGGAVAGLLVLRGALAGRQDALLSRLARWPALRQWIEHKGIARYAVDAVHMSPGEAGCGLRISLTGATFSLVAPGTFRIHANRVDLCTALTAEAEGLQVGTGAQPAILDTAKAQASLREIRLEGAQWSHPAGSPLLAAGELTGTLAPLAGRIARTRLLPAADAALLEIAQADVGPVRLSGTATAIGKLEAEGLRAKLRQEPDGTWNAAAAAPRLQAAANTLLAAADASLAELRRVLSRLRGLFFLAAVLAALLVIGGKLLLLRIPAGLLRRLAIAALPVLLSLFLYALFFGSLSARSFILCAALAAIALAAGLEIAFYRHAAEWHERVEPLLLDLLAPLLILPLLAGYEFPVRLPAGVPRPTSLTIAHTELRDMAAGVDLAFCDTPVAAQARVSLATARNLQASFDPASLGIRSIIIDHAQVAGETDPVALQSLDRLAYLPAAWKHAPRVAFCANATVGSGPLPEECEAAASGSQPSLDAAAAVDFDHLVARLTATVRSPGAGLHLAARADREGASIEEVQSLPGSPVAIGGANGRVSWAGALQSQFRLSRLQAGTAAANFSAGVLELDGNFPLSCQAGRSAFEARAREVRLSAPGGYEMAAEDTRFSARLSAGRELSSTADLRAVHFLGRRPAESAPWLSGDLPLVHMGLRGRSSEGFPPHRLTGEVALAATRSNGEAVLRSSAPLRFSADLWRGALAVPAQSIALEQSIVSRIPSIPARMSLEGHLESLAPLRAQADAQIEIPHLSLAEPPVSAELNQLMLRASLRTPGSPFQLTYGSGWNRIVMPRLPASFELNEVSRMDAATEGSARNLPTWDALSADLDALGQWTRRNLPQISSEVSFRFAGSLPAAAGQPVLTAETSSGAGVRVDAVASTASRIELPDGRLTKAATDTRATGIRTAKGAGDLSFAAHSDLAGDAIGLEISEPVPVHLRSGAGQVELALKGELAMEPLLRKLDPFLAEAGIHLDGLGLPGRVTSLSSTLNFAQSELKGFDFRASLGPGTLAHLDFARMLSPASPRFLRTLDLSQSAPLEIRAVAPPASFPRVDLQFQSPAVAVDLNQGAQRASLAAGAAASLTLVDRGTARSLPVLDRLAAAAGGFRRHVNGALDAFAGEAEPLESVRWKADFGGTGKPVLSLQGDGLELALRSRIDRLAWLAGGRESSAAVSTSLEARLSLHGGHLIVDADTPVRASVALNGRPASTWDFRLPLLLALDEHLQPAAQGSGDLWDAAHYENLWRGYRPRHAIATGAWIDRGELLLGNLSFQEIVFPTAPFRLAAGYGEALELHVPLSARLLFGRSDALFQARLNWLPKAVAVDTRARLAFENVQAGGVGLAHAPGRVAFLEDTLDGSIQTRTDHLIVDSRFLPRFLADASSVTELDKIGVRLEVHSARDGLPGVLQAATDLNVHLYSDLLNSLAQQLRLEAPPRAIRYRRMGLDLQIADGEVATRPVLLDLEGVEIPGLSPIAPAQIRVHWGKERGGFAGSPLRFRNLLGFLQRSLGPPANE